MVRRGLLRALAFTRQDETCARIHLTPAQSAPPPRLPFTTTLPPYQDSRLVNLLLKSLLFLPSFHLTHCSCLLIVGIIPPITNSCPQLPSVALSIYYSCTSTTSNLEPIPAPQTIPTLNHSCTSDNSNLEPTPAPQTFNLEPILPYQHFQPHLIPPT